MATNLLASVGSALRTDMQRDVRQVKIRAAESEKPDQETGTGFAIKQMCDSKT